jgi:hypothetical protein
MSGMVIILSSLTVLLFIFLFAISFSSSKADNALADLMRYLKRLSSDPSEFKNMNPEQERARAEILFNRVKTSNSVATLSSNKEMGDLLTSVIRLISSERLVRPDQSQSSFIQLTNLYSDFKLRYSDG